MCCMLCKIGFFISITAGLMCGLIPIIYLSVSQMPYLLLLVFNYTIAASLFNPAFKNKNK